MKYYSEKLGKVFDTVEACQQAEFKAKEEENRQKILAERKAAEEKERKERATAERKAMAAEVEEARKVMVEAQKKYRDAIDKFVKTYGSYHWSSNSVEDIPTLFDIFNPFIFG